MMKKIIRHLTLTACITALSVCSFTTSAWADPELNNDVEIPGMEGIQEIVKEEQDENKPSRETQTTYAKIDFDYSGKIDDRTGKPVSGDGYTQGKNYHILKSGELGYNSEEGRYYLMCGDKKVFCNVPSGAVLSLGYKISIEAEEELRYTMYLNGLPIADPQQTVFNESGAYTLMVYNDAQTIEKQFEFRILSDVMGVAFKEYSLPPGFEFTEVTLDGNYKTREYKNYYDFLEAGTYKLVWENVQIGQAYTTQFTMDVIPPDLQLTQVKEGKADKAVTFRDLEDGEYAVWVRNHEEQGMITSAADTLEVPGNYILTVYDRAGNFTEYNFTIEGYLDINALLAILIVIALVAGIIIYSRRLRKRMRVG
ncbi:MAG: hypothetical protein IKW01_01950 [Firmicutes bacterium]|nr:hypothetical protein [Bacillota bacterium]